MKKFVLAFLVVFIANLGCKKLDKGDRLCGCSYDESLLTLVIKDTNGVDMLNPATNDYFNKGSIKLYYQNAGTEKQINFGIRQPFEYYGNATTEKFEFYQINSSELLRLASIENSPDFYLKLGNATPLLLKVTVEKGTPKVTKLTVNNVEASLETGDVRKSNPNIFYITLPNPSSPTVQ